MLPNESFDEPKLIKWTKEGAIPIILEGYSNVSAWFHFCCFVPGVPKHFPKCNFVA